MNILGLSLLKAFKASHADARGPLAAWQERVSSVPGGRVRRISSGSIAVQTFWLGIASSSTLRIPMIVTDDSGIVTGDSGDRDRFTHGFAPRATGTSPDGR